jgi:hypothetical protein
VRQGLSGLAATAVSPLPVKSALRRFPGGRIAAPHADIAIAFPAAWQPRFVQATIMLV